MGDIEGWAQPSGLMPNGLLPNKAGSVTRELDLERWSKAEERITELISCIQPNKPSEERRIAVADYVQRLIMKCSSCQVFTFGSVPLKTYLPDGDIDLTAFSKDQNLKDTWAIEVRDMLENEERSENTEFRVKDVQFIQAEVKLVKCLVENIVVDISFNQLGGLCTLCFLEEVDHLINQNHLFKRSIILIKAWCYYESRILGAHHGLISTYALETLVLYIFHVFNNSFVGPLEVLYRFLEFFSNFDWGNFCVSLWGPVPITSLPDMTAEPPRKDNGELLLNKLFLDSCSSVYAVFPGGQETRGQSFAPKYFNVVDPLRTNNNLGRSVSKGNFFRIRSAFAFGAKRLARLLECPEENLITEVNQFFVNTWKRHASGRRPDASSAPMCILRPVNPVHIDASDNRKSYSSGKINNGISTSHEFSFEGTHTFDGLPSHHDNHSSETISNNNNMLAASRTQRQRNHGDPTSSKIPNQVARCITSIGSVHNDKDTKSSRADIFVNGVHGRYQFARTHSSPELTDTANEVTSRGRRCNKVPDGKSQVTSKPDYSRRVISGSEVSGTHGTRSSTDDRSTMRRRSLNQGLDASSNTPNPSSNYHDEAGPREREMHQEEQDLVNMMASSRLHGLGGQPMNFAPHLSLQASPSFLASMGYQKNLVGLVPANIPFVGPPWGSRAQFPQSLLSSPTSHYFPSVGLPSSTEEMVDLSNGNSNLADSNQEGSRGFWIDDQDGGSSRGADSDNRGSQMLQSDDIKQSTSVGVRFVPLPQVSMRGQHRFSKENGGLVSDERIDSFKYQHNKIDEVHLADGNPSSRILPTSQARSSRSKASSESSWDASSMKTSKSVGDRRGRKAQSSSVTCDVNGKGKNGWRYESVSVDHGSSQADDDDDRDWVPLATMNAESAEISGSAESVIPVASMLAGSSSRQRAVDNSGMVPFAFYLTGPPVPFVTMLPMYNFPAEEVSDNRHINQNFDSAESLDESEMFSSCNSTQVVEEHKSDILHSDFTSHWQNLQFGRLCQDPRYSHGPIIYPSPVMVPPVYLQGHLPWEGPGRPASPNSNHVFSQLMSYSPRLVPVAAPLQPGSNRSVGVYQRHDEVPRYRAGTGTYLPNHKSSVRTSNTRNQRGNYNYDRNEHHSDREGNWNSHNSRPRGSGRGYSRSQSDKASPRSDRVGGSSERPSYQPHGSSNSTNNAPANMAYNFGAPNGPSVVMLYPYGNNASSAEQLEFGTFGPLHNSEVGQVEERGSVVYEQRRFQGASTAAPHSSPDQPSSPRVRRQ